MQQQQEDMDNTLQAFARQGGGSGEDVMYNQQATSWGKGTGWKDMGHSSVGMTDLRVGQNATTA